MIKRLISGALSLLICSSMFTSEGIGQKSKSTAPQADNPVNSDMDYKISATNSLGNYINELVEQQDNINPLAVIANKEEKYSIVTMEFDAEKREITLKSTQTYDCKAVVVFSDELNGNKVYEKTIEIKHGEGIITKSVIENLVLPEYYIVTVTLIDETGKVLCQPFINKMYTKIMQEISEKDVHDFNEELVINLDEREDTNFVVLNENTVIAESTDNVNNLASADYDNNVFVFDNADETVKSLESGEYFCIHPSEEDIIAISVDSVEVNENNQVVVNGNDEKQEEIFSFMKFEATVDANDAEVDMSSADEEVSYEGIVSNDGFADVANALKFNISNTNKRAIFDYDKSFDGSFNLSKPIETGTGLEGNISIGINLSFNLYKYKDYTNFNFEIGFPFSVSLSNELKSNDDHNQLSLGTTTIPICTGIMLQVEPKLVLRGSVKFEVSYSAKPGIKATYDSDIGEFNAEPTNDSDEKFSFNISGDLFVGIDFSPRIVAVSEKLAKLELGLEAGVNIHAEIENSLTEDLKETTILGIQGAGDSTHACAICIKGTAAIVLNGGVEFSILSIPFSANIELATVKLPDWYYSFSEDFGFGFGECPNRAYKVSFIVENQKGEPVSGAEIKIDDKIFTTNINGYTEFYTCNGRYEYDIVIDEDIKESSSFTIQNETKDLNVKVGTRASVSESGKKVTTTTTTKTTKTTTTTTQNPKLNEIATIDRGYLGDNIYYSHHANGYLWIYGYGEMDDFDSSPFKHPEKVIEICIEHEDEKNGLTINSIGNNVFSGCSNLPEIEIPDTIASIGDSAFRGCASLTSIEVPGTVKAIGNYAFANCTSLKSAVIKDGVGQIDAAIFSDCTSLEEVTLPYAGATLEGVNATDSSGHVAARLFSTNQTYNQFYGYYIPDSLKKITITGGERIPSNAFRYFNKIETVVLPDTITNIGNSAFYNCNKLLNNQIPDEVKIIDDYAYYGCTSLKSITLPSSVETIGHSAFENCTSFTSVKVPGTVVTLGQCVFSGCTSLKSAVIEDGVGQIGVSIFADCSLLEEVTLPYAGRSLESVNAADSSGHVARILFRSNETAKFFYGYYVMNSLKKITITGGERIPGEAFKYFNNVESIVIPDTITSIGYSAFYNCTGLQQITFNGSAPSICSDAFTGVTTIAYYNVEDDTWTDDVKLNYGGNITWHGIELDEITKKTTTTTSQNTTTTTTTTTTAITSVTTVPLEVTLKGDANCDGKVTIADATAIFQALGNADKYSLSAQGTKNADVIGNNGVMPSDAVQIQAYDAKMIDEL